MIACLLSLLFPGLGQLRNREPWKGLSLAITFPALTMLAGFSRVLLSFKGMLGFLAVLLVWRLGICVEAFRTARQGTEWKRSYRQQLPAFLVAGSLILICGVEPSQEHFLHKFGYFRAFKLPVDSMCPTLCKGERFVADMDAFMKTAPRRGDVVVFDFQSAGNRMVKRVIGVEGDVVSEDGTTILVNGTAFTERDVPQVCGRPRIPSSAGEPILFNPVKVAASSVFVVGDNLANSYDSRTFGVVNLNHIKGKPLYIYWSPGAARIGCAIR